MEESSSWRELTAIKFALAAFEAHLSGVCSFASIFWLVLLLIVGLPSMKLTNLPYGFLEFLWYLGIYCYFLSCISLPLDVYIFGSIQFNAIVFVFYYVLLDVFASGVWATYAGFRGSSEGIGFWIGVHGHRIWSHRDH